MDIKKTLNNIISKIAKDNNEKIHFDRDTMLITDLKFDSVAIVELIIELESVFKIELEDDELDIDILSSYGALYDLIENKVKS